MTARTRKINSTGRKLVSGPQFSARQVGVRPLRAKVDIHLDGLSLPGDARIILEPYYKSVSKRIDCGSVAAPEIPESVDLSELDLGGNILFRLKIIDAADAGKLLAASKKTSLKGEDEDDSPDRKPLLRVRRQNIGDRVWKIEVNDDTEPVLLISDRLPDLEKRLLTDSLLKGAVVIPAVHNILQFLAGHPELAEGSWKDDWIKFIRNIGGEFDLGELKEADARNVWVEDTVQMFARKSGFIETALKQIEQEGGRA